MRMDDFNGDKGSARWTARQVYRMGIGAGKAWSGMVKAWSGMVDGNR